MQPSPNDQPTARWREAISLCLGGEKQEVTIAITLLILGSIATVFAPRILGLIVDHALLPKDSTALVQLLAVWAVVETVRIGANIWQTRVIGRIGNRAMHRIRERLFNHFTALPIAAVDRLGSGELLARITSDVAALSSIFTATFISVIDRIITLLAIVVSIALLNLELWFVSVALLPVVVIIGTIVTIRLHPGYRSLREAVAEVSKHATESLQGADLLLVYGKREDRVAAFRALSEKLARYQVIPSRFIAILHPVSTIASGTTVFLLLWLGSPMVRAGTITAGMLVTVITYVLWLMWPVMQILAQWNTLLAGMVSLNRIMTALHWPTEQALRHTHSSTKKELQVERIAGNIVFDHVWFRYPGSDDFALADLSFSVPAGARLAIVGATGSGKSSVLNLLLGFFEADQGTISLGGVPIQHYSLDTLRDRVGLVQQDPHLFEGTVLENLFAPATDHTAQIAHSLGLDLSAQARSLSLGEQQSVAFLRAFAHRPDIWLLDEATAHLHAQLDAELLKLLRAHAAGKTVVKVVHRLASIEDTDLVLVLHQGRLMQYGSHHALIASPGIYQSMWQIQSEW